MGIRVIFAVSSFYFRTCNKMISLQDRQTDRQTDRLERSQRT
jgi:hypothetical protein